MKTQESMIQAYEKKFFRGIMGMSKTVGERIEEIPAALWPIEIQQCRLPGFLNIMGNYR